MLRIRSALLAMLLAVAVIVPTTAAASPALGQLPGVACATSGPAKSYPSANQTATRHCWWGYELLFSKGDTKLIAIGAGGALSPLVGEYLPEALVVRMLVGGGGAISAEAINRAIDSGKCVKVTVYIHVIPMPGIYHCT